MLTEQQKITIKGTLPALRENAEQLAAHFYKSLLNNNPNLKETFNMGRQRSGAQASALASAVLAYAENINAPEVLVPVIKLVANKHVSLNIQAEDYGIVGEHLLYSFSKILKISMDDEVIIAWKAAYFQLAEIFISIEKKLYQKQVEDNGSWLGWREFIVDKKISENNEVTSFYLIPKAETAIPFFRPGQYISIRVIIPELGIKQSRQYSLTSTTNDKYLRISVKREGVKQNGQAAGYVSSVLHNVIREKDIIEITAPTGEFSLITDSNINVLISAGVGLTPMMSILKHLVKNSAAAIHFIHTTRNYATLAFRDEIHDLVDRHKNVRMYLAYTDSLPTHVMGVNANQQGRLYLNKLDADWLPKKADYYLCGPLKFIEDKRKELKLLGISQEKIHSEFFGTNLLLHSDE